MEEWLQTEWWDWKVYTANVTEQFAQIAVVGPKRAQGAGKAGRHGCLGRGAALHGLGRRHAGGFPGAGLPHLLLGRAQLRDRRAGGQGRALWDALLEAGPTFGVMPYGTEALHIMRAEKGFIMIGDETDGTVIPQDLGLDWAISKKKDDFLGKRAQERTPHDRPDRWKLVGLETLDGSVLPDGAYAVAEG
jgi:sarcosine oxidase subunit alpha